MEDDVCCKLKGSVAAVLTRTSNVIFDLFYDKIGY